MSYTMTIDEPKEAAWFEETRQMMTPSELGALFVIFLRQQIKARVTAARNELAGSAFLKQLRGDGPFLDDGEMHIFDRAKDRGRHLELA